MCQGLLIRVIDLHALCYSESVRTCAQSLSHVRLCVNPQTTAHQAPLFMGFPRQESWNGLPFPSPGDLPNPGIKPMVPALQADSLPAKPSGNPKNAVCLDNTARS